MSDLPTSWRVYARIQERLARRSYVDDHAWGLEEGLNGLVAGEISTDQHADRAVESASRKERHQGNLRRIHLAVANDSMSPESAIDARLRLRVARSQVTNRDWMLLRALGYGYEYSELAAASRMTAGALRARICRLRRVLAERSFNVTCTTSLGLSAAHNGAR
jgi:hypothetical protein